MEKGKESLGTKIKTGAKKFKSHWKTPPEGYQVCYKEFANFALGSGGPNFLGVLTQYTTLATSVHLMISYFKLSTGTCVGVQHCGSDYSHYPFADSFNDD